jgi:hypothetical protein
LWRRFTVRRYAIRTKLVNYHMTRCEQKTNQNKAIIEMSIIYKKTSTISFRIDSEYDKLLRNEAEEKKVSLNTLANQIFGEHLEWQRYAERFGTIVISKNGFRLILESLSEANVVDLAINIAQKNPIEFILFKWKDLSSTNVINFIKMYLGHCCHVQYDYVKDHDTNKFSIRHELGRKGSLFLKAYFETVIQTTLRRDSEITFTDNNITLVFKE